MAIRVTNEDSFLADSCRGFVSCKNCSCNYRLEMKFRHTMENQTGERDVMNARCVLVVLGLIGDKRCAAIFETRLTVNEYSSQQFAA